MSRGSCENPLEATCFQTTLNSWKVSVETGGATYFFLFIPPSLTQMFHIMLRIPNSPCCRITQVRKHIKINLSANSKNKSMKFDASVFMLLLRRVRVKNMERFWKSENNDTAAYFKANYDAPWQKNTVAIKDTLWKNKVGAKILKHRKGDRYVVLPSIS